MKIYSQTVADLEHLLSMCDLASTVESYVHQICQDMSSDAVPDWVQQSDTLAFFFSQSRRSASRLTSELLICLEEYIRLYRAEQERPAPESRPPAGDTPAAD